MDKIYSLIIGGTSYEIPEFVIKTFGEENFNKMQSDIDGVELFNLLIRFDELFSSYITMAAGSEYFVGKGIELSGLVSLADFLAKKGQYDKAIILLYKSIQEFASIHRRAMNNELTIKEM
ncbi:MAG: hypothetical protein ACM3O4_01995 [Ignavibacteriales bacterium]